jgi:hypothetical protein
MVTGHGKTRVYLHRFKLLDHATCVCKKGEQTIDYLLYQCTLLQTHRELLKRNILNNGNWPASKKELIIKYRNSFIKFINSIDFEQLQQGTLSDSLDELQLNDFELLNVRVDKSSPEKLTCIIQHAVLPCCNGTCLINKINKSMV